MRNLIVLVGPPSSGKTTLSKLLSAILKAKYYSFDELFPLAVLKNGNLSRSKVCRRELLNLVANDHSEFIIIDDTCHFNSIQKQYILETENNSDIKLLFLHLSARFDQINLLKARNSLRNGPVTDIDIDSIFSKLAISNFFKQVNFIEYNFEKIPEVDIVVSDIKTALVEYKKRSFEEKRADEMSDSNFYNQLNLALNKEISKYFQYSNRAADGKNISHLKSTFIAEIKKDGIETDLESLVNQFKMKHLGLG